MTFPKPRAASQTKNERRWRMLLVDDSPTVLQHLRRFLVSCPQFEVIATAANGLEAVHVARTLWPDLILMDLLMPGLDGFEATARIRQELPDVPIIAMSVLDPEAAQAAALASGADGFLAKARLFEDFEKEATRLLQPCSHQ